MSKLSNLTRKIIATTTVASLVFSGFTMKTLAATKLYDEKTTKVITKGATYEYSHRLTDAGWQDVHVMKVDLNAENISIQPLIASGEIGLKDTVLNMVKDGEAVAGINTAYFGMTGSHSASFGPEVSEGEILSVGTDKNIDKNEFASFFIDEDGNPFFHYFKTNIKFLNNGSANLEFASINKITKMEYPIVFDSNAASSTKEIDARFPDLVKIVVENGFITKISEKGEIVSTPENGYLVVMNSSYADALLHHYAVGQTAELSVNSSIDLNKITTAVSGGGLLMYNGEKSTDLGEIASGRQPRSLLGLSEDKSTLILMVIDGDRGKGTTSIGATPDEAVAILKEYGVYSAINLDGGGSSTLVGQIAGEEDTKVLNTPAETVQRKVMSSLGVFNTGAVGPIKELRIEPVSTKGFVSNGIEFKVYGFDEYYHKIDVPIDQVSFSSSDPNGSFNGNIYRIGSTGNAVITGTYNSLNATSSVEGMVVSSITPNQPNLSLDVGESFELSFNGVGIDGYLAAIPEGVNLSTDFGTITGNVYTATAEGAGYITCKYGDAIAYIRVSVGKVDKAITSFEGYKTLAFSGYPTDVTGVVGPSTAVVSDGNNSVAISYNFKDSSQTQAAYMMFSSPITISGGVSRLKLNVYGNNSGDWLRARVKDASGNIHVIDLAQNIDWSGWKQVEGIVPTQATHPVVLESIYVASLANTNTSKQVLYFDDLRGTFPAAANIDVPSDVKISDNLSGTIGAKEDGSYYITLAGTVSSQVASKDGNYTESRLKIVNLLKLESDLMIYAGKNDISTNSGVDTIKWGSEYGVYNKTNVTIIQLTAANGGLRNTNSLQWLKFKSEAINSTNDNIIFIMDKTPSNFNDPLEAALFRSALEDIKNAGKTVFVISSSGAGAWNTIKDGIRYVNLPDLWTASGALNNNFKILKFKVNQNSITYEIKNAF